MLNVKDEYHQRLLNVNGYFTKLFIPIEFVDKLKKIYFDNFKENETPFYSTSFHPNLALKKKVNTEIVDLLKNILDDTFFEYKILGSSFLIKSPQSNNPLPLHQDWTVTDEEKYGSYTIWIPLQDTTQQNGALRVIPGSHLVENNYRAPSLPVSFESERELFDNLLINLPLKAGEAFIFNQKLMHASWPNNSKEERLALTIGLVPKDAKLFMLYYNKNNRELSQYAMPDDLFLQYPEIIDYPKIGTLINKKTYTPQRFSYNDFTQQLSKNKNQFSIMQPLFTNVEHQSYFEKNGFIKLNALDANDIQTLTDFLFQSGIKKETDYGFYVGMDHEDKKLVSTMMQKIEQIAMPKLAPYLKDYQLITASYVIKDTNTKGVVPPHQDWTFVEDETQHCSVTCWIALVDTNMENGCMGVIKGSHKFLNNVRPSPSPQVPSPLAKHMFSMFPYFELLPMKAGEALIFDNRTFHASPPNITAMPRIAVGLSFTQKDASLCHYYCKPGTKDTLLKYKIDPVFFMKYDNGTLSKMYDAGKVIQDYELIGEEKYVFEELSKSEMKKRILNAGNVYNKNLTQHMIKLFGDQMKDGMKEKVLNVIHTFNPIRIFKKITQ